MYEVRGAVCDVCNRRIKDHGDVFVRARGAARLVYGGTEVGGIVCKICYQDFVDKGLVSMESDAANAEALDFLQSHGLLREVRIKSTPSPTDMTGLVNALDDEEPDVAIFAAKTLGTLATDEAVDALISVIRKERGRYTSVREAAIRALVECGGARALAPIRECLSDWMLVAAAKDAIGRIAAREPAADLPEPPER